MTDNQLREARDALDELLRARLPTMNFVSIQLEPDIDHYGDPIVWVEASYRGSDAGLYSETALGLITEIWDRLQAMGIEAFPIERFVDVDEEPYGAAC